jgi:hypothetical protein
MTPSVSSGTPAEKVRQEEQQWWNGNPIPSWSEIACATSLEPAYVDTYLWTSRFSPGLAIIGSVNEQLFAEIRVGAMRCIECGTEMRLLERVQDDGMMVRGYWHHTFECPNCRKAERRLIFDRSKRSLTGRNVQISCDPSRQADYVATDTKTGLTVMRHQDVARLRELCEWMGWQVVDGRLPERLPDDGRPMR